MANNAPASAAGCGASGGGGGSGKLRRAGGGFQRAIRYEHLVAGMSGGVVSTLVLHPLDLLKVRFAVDDGKDSSRPRYSGIRQAFSSIFRQEGFKGLYKGVTPNITGAGSSWGFYFFFYDMIKTEMQGGNAQTQLSPGKHMLAAAGSGVLTLVMTNPIWVVKTRLCLQYDIAGSKTGVVVYRGMFDALHKIRKLEGVRGLYKGFVPGLWGVSHGAVQFMAYEELKSGYNNFRQRPINTKLTTLEYLAFAAGSKLFAAIVTYPYQVVRARLQEQNSSYEGAMECVTQTVKHEGMKGLYKGITPYLIHVMPNICLVFIIYEKMSK